MLQVAGPECLWIVHRVSSSLLGPVVPSFRALSGRLKFTVRRHKFNKDSRVWRFQGPLPSEQGNNLKGSKDLRLKNGSSQGQNLAVTVLFVLNALDSAPPPKKTVSGFGVRGSGSRFRVQDLA